VALTILMELNIRLTVLVVETDRLERRGVNDICNVKFINVVCKVFTSIVVASSINIG